jgi:hypothetical protein
MTMVVALSPPGTHSSGWNRTSTGSLASVADRQARGSSCRNPGSERPSYPLERPRESLLLVYPVHARPDYESKAMSAVVPLG